MEFLQELFARGINPGTAGAVQVKQSVGSAVPRIPPPANSVTVDRDWETPYHLQVRFR